MSAPLHGALEGALAGQLPPPQDADAVAGAVPPLPIEDAEGAAATLERTVGPAFASRMRRAWWRAHERREAGEVGRAPSAPRTTLYDPTCPHCLGLGLVADRSRATHTTYTVCPCGADAKRRAAQRAAAAHSLLARYPHATMAATEDRPHQRPAIEAILGFLEDYEYLEPSWLTLLGDTSGGKTWLAAVLGNALLERGAPVLMLSSPDLLDHLRAAFNPHVGGQDDALFERVRTVEALILDDLGAQKTTDWASEKLYQLFEERTINERPTVVTTNEPLANLGPRIAGRLLYRERRRLCVVETGRAGPSQHGLYLFGREQVICRDCHCRPCMDDCATQTIPDTLERKAARAGLSPLAWLQRDQERHGIAFGERFPEHPAAREARALLAGADLTTAAVTEEGR